MANRSALLTQSDATRYLKAAKAAGFDRARLVIHPDSRVEVIAEAATEQTETARSNEWDELLK